jgi:transcriptional regulator with XRE-family HTH domain
MDVCLVIKERLEELGLEQKDLATAAHVTESYISQLLTRKKLPPAPDRTDIYEKMSVILKLPKEKLARLAHAQRREEMRRIFEEPPVPLFEDVRGLLLRKCAPDRHDAVRAIFEKQSFGELERLVAQTLLDVIKGVARKELDNEKWLRSLARFSGGGHEQSRVRILEFLDADVLHLSGENCATFLDPLLQSWDIDLPSFGTTFVLNHGLVPGYLKRFDFVEKRDGAAEEEQPGLAQFLRDSTFSGKMTAEEIEFLQGLRFKGRRPTPLYYYRELQNFRDPLHFELERH